MRTHHRDYATSLLATLERWLRGLERSAPAQRNCDKVQGARWRRRKLTTSEIYW
ncbi:hypothetical protein BCR44DRAFT_1430549, partial [Catenaria anguillulae PL171]